MSLDAGWSQGALSLDTGCTRWSLQDHVAACEPGLTAAPSTVLWPGRAPPSASQLLAFSPGQEQAAGELGTPQPQDSKKQLSVVYQLVYGIYNSNPKSL